MSTQLHIARVALTGRATVADTILKQFFSSPVSELGALLARQIHDFVIEQQLGYYPPLDYVQEQQAVDEYLLDAVTEVSQVAMDVARREIETSLQPVFSSVTIESLQSVVYTMPKVRVGQPDALDALSSHYTPNRVKFDLSVTLIQKQEKKTGLEKMVEGMVQRWLSDAFEEIETGAARLVV